MTEQEYKEISSGNKIVYDNVIEYIQNNGVERKLKGTSRVLYFLKQGVIVFNPETKAISIRDINHQTFKNLKEIIGRTI